MKYINLSSGNEKQENCAEPTAFWSGNSEGYSQDVFDLLIVNGSVEFDYIVDPSIVITDVSVGGGLTNITAENNFTHLNISDSNLELYYPFDVENTTNKTYDYSENNNDGTIINATFNSSGKYGSAYNFDGIDDRISFANTASLKFGRSPFTVSLWFRENSTLQTKYLIDGKRSGANSNGWQISKSSATTVSFSLGNGTATRGVTSTGPINNNIWHHLVGKRNATGIYIYLNGALNNSNTTSLAETFNVNFTATGDPFMIGSTMLVPQTSFFNGSIDEVMIFSKELSDTEINSIYNNQSSRFFSRGEQIFTNKNVSGDGTENKVNITINSSMLFGSMINVSVGANQSDGTYTYGSEYAFTNNFVSGVPINTPVNFSLKFIFYAGSSTNPFISPALISSINITSYSADVTAPVVNLIAPVNGTSSGSATHSFNATFSDNVGLANATFYLWNSTSSIVNTTTNSLSGTTGSVNLSVTLPYADTFLWNYLATDTNNNQAFNSTNFTITYTTSNPVPYSVLNSPANSSIFWRGIFNLTLNATAIDPDGDNMTARIFAGNYTYSATQLYQHGLIYQRTATANNTELIYNWTALPVFPDSSTVLLMHFDNRSEYGENQTYVYDFSGNGNNGAANRDAAPNMSSGKFAGEFIFDGVGDYVKVADSNSLDFTTNFSVSAWIMVRGDGTKQHIVSKANFDGASPDWAIWYNQTNQDVYFGNSSSAIDSDCIAGQTGQAIQNNVWYHVFVMLVSSGPVTSGPVMYVNGLLVNGGGCVSPAAPFTSFPANAVALGIGGPGFSFISSNGFNGTIDEVAIWNRTLSTTEIQNLYRLNANKYVWKVNLTDSDGAGNESELREVIVRDTTFNVESSQTCSDIYNSAILLGQGYNCGVASYPTCLGLNVDLNISSGSVLSLNASCQLYFNTSSDGSLNLYAHGNLNLSGANITATSALNKFNLSSFSSELFTLGSYGNLSLANINKYTNITDSQINIYSVDVKENRTVLLNSSDFASYALEGGSVERKFRLNVSTYSSGAIITGVNVTARNVSNAIIFSKTSGSDGAAYYNLTQYLDTGNGKVYQSNYTINVTKTSYFPNSTSFNLTGDTNIGLSLREIDNIEVTGTETLHDIFSRINDSYLFSNLSDGTRPCRYVAKADINVSTGMLVMDGCTLEMNNSIGAGGDGTNNFYISGTLRANYSNFTSSDASHRYQFQALTGSSFTLKNSFVSYTGHSVNDLTRGLSINTTNVTFENNTLSKAYEADLEILSSNVIFKGSRFLGNAGSGTQTLYNIRCVYCQNVTIQDSDASGSTSSNVVVGASQSINILNTNYSSKNVDATARLYRQWYVDGVVRNTGGAGISGVNVTFYNRTGALTYTSMTNSSGDIVRQNVTEYIVNSTQTTYQTNYTINASIIGYELGTQSLNVTTNNNISFSLAGGDTPGITLDAPTNASIENINSGVLLKTNVSDTYSDLVDIFIYGVNSTSTAQMFKHGLLYQKIDAVNGENITYNWTAPTVIPDSSTVLLYHFDNRSFYGENQTHIYDYSGNGNNGTTNGNAASNMTSGKFAGGFMFDGGGDYVSVLDSTSLRFYTNMTWSAWVKPGSTAGDPTYAYGGLFSRGGLTEAYSLGISGGRLYFLKPNPPESTDKIEGGNYVFVGNWTHVSVVFNQNTQFVYLYVNGVLDTSGSLSGGQGDAGTSLLIGRASECDSDQVCDPLYTIDFNGTIDEVGIWNRTLSATEVQDLYRLKIDKYYWEVNATDYSGFSNESAMSEFNVTNPNVAPQIVSVSSIGTVGPTENGVQYVNFTFIMNDSNGVADLNDTSVRANFTRGGEALRQNSSCSLVGDIDSVSANYSCTIGMWYFDGAGNWNVTVYGTDIAGLSAQNSTTTFSYSETISFVLSPEIISWGTVTQGQTNRSQNGAALISTTLNNTGNYNSVGINITAIDLYGVSNSAYSIGAGNFSVGLIGYEGGTEQCISDLLINGTQKLITGAVLNKGDHSINDGETGQELLHYCIVQVPVNIPSQVYSTSTGGAWIVRIFAATLVLGGAGRRKKKKLEEEILGARRRKSKKLVGELIEKYGESLRGFLEIDKELKERYGLGIEQVKELIGEKVNDVEVPISIFSEEIGAAEALCKYLKENKGMTYSEIARFIGRDQRTIWVNYHNAKKKMKEEIKDVGGFSVSVRIFASGEHSILEALISYLRRKGFKNVEVAKMINKDPRNVWTMYSRAVKKSRVEAR